MFWSYFSKYDARNVFSSVFSSVSSPMSFIRQSTSDESIELLLSLSYFLNAAFASSSRFCAKASMSDGDDGTAPFLGTGIVARAGLGGLARKPISIDGAS